jgi:predicted enzyme related to lactoylglutathione lyase
VKVNSLYIQLTSNDPERLYTFYKDTVGLPLMEGMGRYTFNICGAALGIDGHSDTDGQAKEPNRLFLDFFVDDVKAERERLEAAGVQFIRNEGQEPWGGVISTFVDPDGNYGQIIEFRPTEGTQTA